MFTKDNRAETFLSQMGVTYRYTNALKFDALESGWEKTNLSRPVIMREEAVFEYASLTEGGSAAPAIIVAKRGRLYRVLDGRQRLFAAKMIGCSQLSAYVVESDSEDTLAAISVLANARLQGRAEPAEWTRRRAVEVLVIERGMTTGEVARMGGWRLADIESTARILKWSAVIRSVGGPELPDTLIDVIGEYATHEDITCAPKPVVELLGLLKRGRFSADDAKPFVQEFFAGAHKKREMHHVFTERLNRIKNDPEVVVRIHGRKGGEQPKDITLRRTLKAAINLVDGVIASGEQLQYADEFFRLIKVLDEKLRAIATHCPRKRTAPTPADMWSGSEDA